MPSPKNSDFNRIADKAKVQLADRLPFVLYRKPLKNFVTGLFQKDNVASCTTDFTEQGFLFAPFDGDRASILLKPDEHVVSNLKFSRRCTQGYPSIDKGRVEHIKLVNKAIEEMANGRLQKVIVSRKIDARTSKDCFEIFKSALCKYQSSFCYLWYHRETGIWVGASPELFLKVDEKQMKTVSLAGTVKTENAVKPKWGSKEIEEQQMVTDYINTCLHQELEHVEVSGPETIKAGAVWHLKSTFTGKIDERFNMGRLIKNLHPTPAVCGFPKERAFRFIKENEHYSRDFYTGFLGELNLDNKTNLFVNLRCMKLNENNVSVYVGGGITKDSIPESEWQETQHKSQTMLSLL